MNAWQDDFVTANGIRLHYWRTGGDKPPLVLSHGITDSGLCWAREAKVLESDYDVIMVDARGHGLSDQPDQGYTPGDHAADLAALIETLALDRPRLMGHSMGAMTTALMAYQRPDLASRVVLEDPPFRDQNLGDAATNAQEMEEWKKRLAAQQQLSTTEIIAAGRVVNPGWAEEVFPPWADAKK
jgi:N-formylmaleamate deformylase